MCTAVFLPHPEYIQRWATQAVLSRVCSLGEEIGEHDIYVDLSCLEELLTGKDKELKELFVTGELRMPPSVTAIRQLPVALRRAIVKQTLDGQPQTSPPALAKDFGTDLASTQLFISRAAQYLSTNSAAAWEKVDRTCAAGLRWEVFHGVFSRFGVSESPIIADDNEKTRIAKKYDLNVAEMEEVCSKIQAML